MKSIPLSEIYPLKQKLTEKAERFSDNYGYIKADNGDLYDFRSKRKFNVGDWVEFEPVDSRLAFELAMPGGPISCVREKT